jgi:hypothetical protein
VVLAASPQRFSFGIRGVGISATNSVSAVFAPALQFWCHAAASSQRFSFGISGVRLSVSNSASANFASVLQFRRRQLSPSRFNFGVSGLRLIIFLDLMTHLFELNGQQAPGFLRDNLELLVNY